MDDNSKLSMNNMLEMAMGVSMVSSMSHILNSTMHSSYHAANTRMGVPVKYLYAIIDGKQCGPYTNAEIMEFMRAGAITSESYMWKSGMVEWLKVKDMKEIEVVSTTLPTPPSGL